MDGPGGFAMINVDGEGEVAGFRSVWRPTCRARPRRSRSSTPAGRHEAMERIARQVHGDTTVIKASFGYFELGILDRQRFLQPAYIMVYVVTDGEVACKSAEVVAAAERPLRAVPGREALPGRPAAGAQGAHARRNRA